MQLVSNVISCNQHTSVNKLHLTSGLECIKDDPVLLLSEWGQSAAVTTAICSARIIQTRDGLFVYSCLGGGGFSCSSLHSVLVGTSTTTISGRCIRCTRLGGSHPNIQVSSQTNRSHAARVDELRDMLEFTCRIESRTVYKGWTHTIKQLLKNVAGRCTFS